MKSWKELPMGGVIEAKNSVDVKTGSWRSVKPVINRDKCVNCMTCWAACPDHAITSDDGKFGEFDYDHCKGCGLCAEECPVKAIIMEKDV